MITSTISSLLLALVVISAVVTLVEEAILT